MARAPARNGRIYIDISSAANGSATPVSFISEWTIDQESPLIDVTSFGDTTQTSVAALPAASGTMAGFVNMGSTTFSTLADGNARKLYLYPDQSNNVGTYFFCTATFSANYEGSVGDALKVSLNWAAATSGAWVSGV